MFINLCNVSLPALPQSPSTCIYLGTGFQSKLSFVVFPSHQRDELSSECPVDYTALCQILILGLLKMSSFRNLCKDRNVFCNKVTHYHCQSRATSKYGKWMRSEEDPGVLLLVALSGDIYTQHLEEPKEVVALLF